MLDGNIVDQISRLDVVGAIQQQVHPYGEFLDVPGMHIHHTLIDRDGRIHRPQPAGGRSSLRISLLRIALIVQHLPLQIGQLDDVPVGEAQVSHPGPDKLVGQHASQRPATDQQHARRRQPLLAGRADLPQERLPVVTILR